MADEDDINEPSEVETRIKDLSKKVKLTSEERDELKGLNATLTTEKESITKERDFYASFSDVVSTHPAAKDHKDAILEKVKAGYTVEDATVSVLNKEGKLIPPTVERQSPVGGSADVSITSKPNKTPQEMTQADRRAALMEAESKGDIAVG